MGSPTHGRARASSRRSPRKTTAFAKANLSGQPGGCRVRNGKREDAPPAEAIAVAPPRRAAARRADGRMQTFEN